MISEIQEKTKETEFGPIPEDWDLLPIYDLAIWINGLAFKNINFSSNGKPVIKINELKYGVTEQTRFTNDVFSNDYFLSKGDLLFSWSGSPDTSIDAFWYNLPDGWLNQHIFKVKPKDKVTVDFLYYLFKVNKQRFIEIARDKQTTGLGHVTIADLKRFNVVLPEIYEQKKIAEILSSLDDKIELNRQENSNLEKLANVLFKHWFVDFEFPDKDGKPYKSSGGKMIDSELGKIPERWKAGELTDVCEFNPVYSLPKGTIAKYAEMKDLPETGMSIRNFIAREFKSGSKFANDDTLLARITPCLENGKTGYVDFLGNSEIGWGSTEFIVLHPARRELSEFLYIQSRLDSFREHAIQSMSGSSGRQRVQINSLVAYRIIVPDKLTILKFHELVRPLFEQIKFNFDQSKRLTEVRDSLLPRLMSGKIRLNI